MYFKPQAPFCILFTSLITAFFIVSTRYNGARDNRLFGITLSAALFGAGLFLYTIEKDKIPFLKEQKTIFSGTLTDYPVTKPNSCLATLKIHNIITGPGTERSGGSILIYFRKNAGLSPLLPGDQMIVSCRPVRITNKGNPFEFDYRFFMENQGVRYYAFADSADILETRSPRLRKPVYSALILREKLIGMYRARNITGDRLALVAAIILGQKNMLDPEQKQDFIKAGVMHIMAVSGLHAVILSMFIFSVLFFLKGRLNVIRVILTIGFLWCFAFVTGLTPSVLRATIMFTFLQAGNLMKRKANEINSVLASAVLLILIKPSVIFEAGFLLSYSAVLFIIVFYKALYNALIVRKKIADKIWQSAVVTIVAQAGTLSLTIMLFNRFPAWFILSNIIIVPVSSLVIITGSLVPLTFPLKTVSQLIASLLSFLTGLTETLTEKAASLPMSSIDNIGMTTIECILLWITIFITGLYIAHRKSIMAIVPVSMILACTLAGTVKNIIVKRSNELIVYDTPGITSIGIRTGKILNLYTDTLTVAPAVMKHCSTLGLRICNRILTNEPVCIRTGPRDILITGSLNMKFPPGSDPGYIIYTGNSQGLTMKNGNRNTILVVTKAAEVPGRYSRHYSADSTFYIRSSGAFIASL